MSALIVIGCVIAYLLIGGLVARASIPSLWAQANKAWFCNGIARGDVVGGVIARCLLWPLMGPYEVLARSIDRQNPEELKRIACEAEDQARKQDKRIKELERELGL